MAGFSSKRIAKNTMFLYLRMGIVLIVSLFTTRIVLKALGVEDYGIYNVVCGFVSLFAFFNNTLSGSINRFYNYEIGKNNDTGVRDVYNTALQIQFVIVIVLVLIVETVGLWYIYNMMDIPDLRRSVAIWIFQFSLISLALTLLQAPYSAAVMAFEKMDYYAFVNVLDCFLKLLIAYLIMASSFDKLLLYGCLMMMISVINFFLYYIYVKRKFFMFSFTLHFDKSRLKKMLSFSGWSFLDPISYTIRGQGCNMVLNSFFGPIINAAYAISNQVAAGLDSFAGSISIAFRPQLVQSYASGNYVLTKKLMFSMSKIMFAINAMIFIPFIFEMHFVLNLWLGHDYPPYTLTFTIYILIIKLINTLNSPMTNVAFAVGNVKKYMIFSAIVVSSILPFSIVLLKIGYNPETMYILMLILTIVNLIGVFHILTQMFPVVSIFDYLKSVVIPCSLQSIILVITCGLINYYLTPSVYRFVLTIIGSLVFSTLSGFLVFFNVEEKRVFMNMIKKITTNSI